MSALHEDAKTLVDLGTAVVPPGQIWVCGACGKTSRTRYGFLEDGTSYLPDGRRVASPGWDESCMMNAVLCLEKRDEDGRYHVIDGRAEGDE